MKCGECKAWIRHDDKGRICKSGECTIDATITDENHECDID